MKSDLRLLPWVLVVVTCSASAADRSQPLPGGLAPEQYRQHQQHIQQQRKHRQEMHDKMVREAGAKRLKERIDK